MKQKSFRIGGLEIKSDTLAYIIFALFVVGIGIGATVASKGSSFFALGVCSLIAIVIIFRGFQRGA